MTDPQFSSAILNPFGLIKKVVSESSPTFVDIDRDGDLDAFVGSSTGNVVYYRNLGSASVPLFDSPLINPLGLNGKVDIGGSCKPSFADIDGDGDLDAFFGSKSGKIFYYKNIGTASDPNFAAPSADPFGLVKKVLSNSSPSFVDIDGDGDLDAFVGSITGNIVYYQNIGTLTAPNFATPIINPLGLTKVGGSNSPTFIDIDGDGDFDALVGASDGNTYFYLNNGTPANPSFAESATNSFGLTNVGANSSPTFADINADGGLDAVVGASDRNLYFYQNGVFLNSNSVLGTNADEQFYATDKLDLIQALGGNDSVSGDLVNLQSNEIYDGGEGIDNFILIGGASDQVLTLNLKAANQWTSLTHSTISSLTLKSFETITLTQFLGRANVTGNSEANLLRGGMGDDTLRGGDGDDTLRGNAGNDILDGGNGNDLLREFADVDFTVKEGSLSGLGNDTFTNIEIVRLVGGVSHNTLDASTLTTTRAFLFGLAGNDSLMGGAASDILSGGAGNDTFDGGDGTDSLRESANVDFIVTEGTLTGLGADTFTNIEMIQLSGGVSNNRLDASALTTNRAILHGREGDDILTGGKKSDSLYGDGGADSLTGGLGNDRLYLGVDTVTDTVNYVAGDGKDLVFDFFRGIGGDILNFSGITQIDVQASGGQTQLRRSAATFGTGALLLTVQGVTDFSESDVGVNFTGAEFKFS